MKPSVAAPKTLRCAIYTRVSTDHGLDQDFNSIDAQREAGEAYVKSQAHEGWRLVKDRFDDGGFSGASMERPALQKLLAEIRARRIDVIVVYKVDRLTRALADFAKLVELFDAQQVSFVSVTQAFNTTSSMGRLTLNVLLSFAQFEREVTGERIRDKIAASKKKGIWVGGVIPLGYRVENRKLLIDETEAPTVRLIFGRYLALESLPALQTELRASGVRTRPRTLASGKTRGGVAFTNGPLAYLLRNRVYLGELNHRDRSYLGEHKPIVPQGLFDAVQAKLTQNRQGGRAGRAASQAVLLGLLFDDRGNRMTPSFCVKNGVHYRYYVSSVLAQGRKHEAGSVPRVSAPEIEALVQGAVRGARPVAVQRSDDVSGASDNEIIEQHVERVEVHAKAIKVILTSDENEQTTDEPAPPPLQIPWLAPSRFRRIEVIEPAEKEAIDRRPIRAEARSTLLAWIAIGRRWLDDIVAGKVDVTAIAAREDKSERSIRMMVSLAFLAPDIVKAAIEGRLPRSVGVSRLTELPMDWSEQRRVLGLAQPSMFHPKVLT